MKTPEKTEKELKKMFGKDYDLVMEYREKDLAVKEYEKKKSLTDDEKSKKHEIEAERALKLEKLNARGYVTTAQLEQDIANGTCSFDIGIRDSDKLIDTTKPSSSEADGSVL